MSHFPPQPALSLALAVNSFQLQLQSQRNESKKCSDSRWKFILKLPSTPPLYKYVQNLHCFRSPFYGRLQNRFSSRRIIFHLFEESLRHYAHIIFTHSSSIFPPRFFSLSEFEINDGEVTQSWLILNLSDLHIMIIAFWGLRFEKNEKEIIVNRWGFSCFWECWTRCFKWIFECDNEVSIYSEQNILINLKAFGGISSICGKKFF